MVALTVASAVPKAMYGIGQGDAAREADTS